MKMNNGWRLGMAMAMLTLAHGPDVSVAQVNTDARDPKRPVRLALDEIRVKGCYHHAALMRELMGKGAAPKPVARLPELTDRELDVLRQLAVNAQYTCERIADVLGIGLSSVKTHMKNLYKKLDVHSKTEAVLEALKLGLLSLADLHPAV